MSWVRAEHISYGFALSTFAPSTLGTDGSAGTRDTLEGTDGLNAHQIPLEVGDEVYVFEVYRPAHGTHEPDAGVWYRGYVVSTCSNPQLPQSSSDSYPFRSPLTAGPVTDEPQVMVGIFPASHVHIREQLDDGEPVSGANGVPTIALSSSRERAGRMEALKEEDEAEDDPANLTKSSQSSPIKSRNRTSVASFSSFASPQGSRAPPRTDLGDTSKPFPPIPSLKCGDETTGGVEEPLVDEIACALREWSTLMYTHLHQRDYKRFNSVKLHVEALHVGRRQLLAKTLSLDETEKLRKEMVSRLVRGNVEQGLDVIVRHPSTGGLVNVNVEDDAERQGWVSAVRMYAMQVTLAYSGVVSDGGLGSNAPSLLPTLFDHLPSSPSNPRLSIPNIVKPPPPSPRLGTSSPPPVGAKFYHVFLELRTFVAQPCAPGATVELYFSLFNKTDARYVTEEFCVVLDHNGTPTRAAEGGLGGMKALFRDLSQHDVQDQIFLVCRIVINGALKGRSGGLPSSSSGHLATLPNGRYEAGSSSNGSEDKSTRSEGMLSLDTAGRQSHRRPFGCAVLEISQFNSSELSASHEHHMPIFVAANEAAFSTLHEDIISSRIKDIAKSPRAEHLAVNVRIMYGEAGALVQENTSLLLNVPVAARLGFPDVVYPGDERNEVYLKLWSGDFTGGMAKSVRGIAQLAAVGGSKNVEVTVEVRTKEGAILNNVLSRGSGEPMVSQFHSMVFHNNASPTWGELVKLQVSPDVMEHCHLFFTFRSRGSKNTAASTPTVPTSPIDKPFAFAYFPLFLDTTAFVGDGSHTLVLYRYDKNVATPQFYFYAPPLHVAGNTAPLPASTIKSSLVALKDTMVVRSFLVSTRYTQNETLLKLLKWETTLLQDSSELHDVLTKLRFCSEVEVCKFLRDVFDALFGILISVANQAGEVDDLVFQALVTILGIISDRRFTNFRPVVDVYIALHFTCSTASSHIIKSLHKLLRTPGSAEAGTTLRASLKVWDYLVKFIVRSREIQGAKYVGSGVTSDHLDSTFKRELSALLAQVNSLLRLSSPSSIIGTQTLAIQHFASILPDLAKCYADQELSDLAIAFVDSITSKGKIVVWKILLLNQLVNGILFESPTGRAALVPNIVRWLKPSLGKFDENMLCSPKDTQEKRERERVGWIEGIRLAAGVVAAMLDSIQEALIDPIICGSRSLLAQEQDSIEYLLGLVPRLLDSYRELEDVANLDAVERQRNQGSIVPAIPVVFPSSYPFALLSRELDRDVDEAGGDGQARPSLRGGVGDVACVFLTLLLLAPRKIFVNYLETSLEVDGKENFARQLTQLLRVATSILRNDAFPAEWLNINILAHHVVVKFAQPIADLLEREFIPAQSASSTFNTTLWCEFFTSLLTLLASPQLLIEEFAPQKRRAVWRLAGDLRGDGCKILKRLWDAIGWPEDTEERPLGGTSGGYQVHFVPGLVEEVLSLCLSSSHDAMRAVGVHMLHSMIVSEYRLTGEFSVIEGEVINRLDRLFMHEAKGHQLSRAFFVGQLRELFDRSTTDDTLRSQVDAFLASIDDFLDHLMAVRGLPDGDAYQEDRIVSTLKLMMFVRGIGQSTVFVRYVNRLVAYHAFSGNETEAGLTLKLHADIYAWDLSTFVEAIPDLDLPRQTEFARKESLYLRILAHLGKGKAWEVALGICKELQHEYETRSFSYGRLSELLVLQSEFYTHIISTERPFFEYFRVAFYGGFPTAISGKQFVFRGSEGEKLASFTEKMLDRHPAALLLKSSSIPQDDIQFSEAPYLQVTGVNPDPDRPSSTIFTNPDVPSAVRQYYERNETPFFCFTRPINKDGEVNEFMSLWTEKTVLICEDSFPSVLRRSEIVEIRITEISPIETALLDLATQSSVLVELEHRYRALGKTVTTEDERTRIRTGDLSMLLNSLVDAPENTGTIRYKAFLTTSYRLQNPEVAPLVEKLAVAMDDMARNIHACLQLHAHLAPQEMRSFHSTLETFFLMHYSEEISRLSLSMSREELDSDLTTSLPPISQRSTHSTTSASPRKPPSSINSHQLTRNGSITSVTPSMSTITASSSRRGV